VETTNIHQKTDGEIGVFLENGYCQEREAEGRILKRMMQRLTYFHFILQSQFYVYVTQEVSEVMSNKEM
jgi:hypothetical protein